MEFGAISQCSANISKCIFIGKQSCSHGLPIGIYEINAGFNFIFGQCWTNQIAQSLFDGGNFVRGLQVLPQSSDSLFTFITSELAKESKKIIIYLGGNIWFNTYWLFFSWVSEDLDIIWGTDLKKNPKKTGQYVLESTDHIFLRQISYPLAKAKMATKTTAYCMMCDVWIKWE